MICLYIDDILIFGSNLECVEETKLFLSSNFVMKHLGEPDMILGMKIFRIDSGPALI